jgi:hypothetical protein
MASGVVDQIRITETKAAGSDIFILRQEWNDKNEKATEVVCGLFGKLLLRKTKR